VDGSKVGEGGRSVLVQEDNIPVLYFKPIRNISSRLVNQQ